MQTRKQFLKSSLAMAAGYSFLHGFANDVRAQKTERNFTFDLHCHPGRLFASAAGGFGEVGSTRTVIDMKNAYVSGAFFSLVADSPLIRLGATGVLIAGQFAPGEAWKEYQRQMKDMKNFLGNVSVAIGKHKKDLEYSQQVTAYLSVEGGDFLEASVDNVDEAYQDGVRSIQLVLMFADRQPC